MGFYVLGDQGQKYGPADVETLNQWVGEGRLQPQTMLEDEHSGLRMVASAVGGLQFPLVAPPPTSNYPRPDQTAFVHPPQYQTTNSTGGVSDFRLALLFALISPIVSYLLPIGGIFTAGYALRAAVRAKNEGHPLGILAIVLSVLALCFWAFTRATGLGRGVLLR